MNEDKPTETITMIVMREGVKGLEFAPDSGFYTKKVINAELLHDLKGICGMDPYDEAINILAAEIKAEMFKK